MTTAVFPVAAVATVNILKAFDKLEAHQVLRLLVAKLPFDTQTQRRAIADLRNNRQLTGLSGMLVILPD